MSKFIDRTGQRFGKLVVLRRAPNRKSNEASWVCQCDCGNVTVVVSGNLSSKNTQSCSKRCGHTKRPFEWIFNKMVKRAVARDVKCLLKYEDFLTFTCVNTCYYCESEIQWDSNPNRNFSYSQSYYLDRKDSNGNYTKENCVVCCPTCNLMKRTMSVNDFIEHCRKITNKHIK